MEWTLHQIGYTYLGPNSLYNLTWYEIIRLTDASQILDDMRNNVREGDLDKLDKFHNRLKAKAR